MIASNELAHFQERTFPYVKSSLLSSNTFFLSATLKETQKILSIGPSYSVELVHTVTMLSFNAADSHRFLIAYKAEGTA